MNIVNYVTLKIANITATTDPKPLLDLIEEFNPGIKDRIKNNTIQLNSMRVYVKSGSAGFRFDGNLVSQDTYIGVDESQHLLENCPLENVSVCGIGGDASFTIQIGHI